MNRLDSEYVRNKLKKHIITHISYKSLLKRYEAQKNRSEKPLTAWSCLWKLLISELEFTAEEISKFIGTLRLNSKKKVYSPKQELKLYIYLLARTSNSWWK